MNLNDSELQQMCRHLGHTTKVHLTHYRTMIPFVERVTLGKVLLMQDLNIQSKFVGKTLNDVDFLDIIKDCGNSENSIETPESSEAPQPEVEPEPEPENVFQFNEDDDMMDVTDESDQEPARHSTRREKNKKDTKRQKWSEKETEELKKFFSKHLDRKVAPRRADCLKAKQESFKNGGELHKRSWHLIVKKISAINHKK